LFFEGRSRRALAIVLSFDLEFPTDRAFTEARYGVSRKISMFPGVLDHGREWMEWGRNSSFRCEFVANLRWVARRRSIFSTRIENQG
jgi:hypothetical protein